ncbi:hypothetical protein GPALN_002250 [Globodera pallida]|nr:hypothetical protein GPALN_002250 [Globodera pallida]
MEKIQLLQEELESKENVGNSSDEDAQKDEGYRTFRPLDISPMDISRLGHFAHGHFARRTFHPSDISPAEFMGETSVFSLPGETSVFSLSGEMSMGEMFMGETSVLSLPGETSVFSLPGEMSKGRCPDTKDEALLCGLFPRDGGTVTPARLATRKEPKSSVSSKQSTRFVISSCH